MNFGVLFHSNSVTVGTKGGIKLKVRLPDGNEEVYLIEAGVPDMLIKNVILGTKYVYWTGDLHIKSSSGIQAQMVFGYKDNKNTINGVIWRESSGEKKKEEAKKEKSSGWATRWAKGAVNAAKSTAKLATGWVYTYSEDEESWLQSMEPQFDPNNILARFSGVGGSEIWLYPGEFVQIDPSTQKPKPLAERERTLLVDPRQLKTCEITTFPDWDKLEENSSIKVWKEVGDAIIEDNVELADQKKN